jgi:hypothetical protein
MLLRGGEGRGVTAFLRDDQKNLKVLAIFSLGLRHVLVTLAIPTFLVRMSL